MPEQENTVTQSLQPERSPEIDESIAQVERLYRSVAGRDAPPLTAPYAPIPPEKNPQQYVQEQLERLVNLVGVNLIGASATPQIVAPSGTVFSPPVAIWEGIHEVLICVELAGVPRDAVEVSQTANLLVISGVRPRPSGDVRPTVIERPYGPFRRVISLAAGVQMEPPAAQMKDGVLEIRLTRSNSGMGVVKAVPIQPGQG